MTLLYPFRELERKLLRRITPKRSASAPPALTDSQVKRLTAAIFE